MKVILNALYNQHFGTSLFGCVIIFTLSMQPAHANQHDANNYPSIPCNLTLPKPASYILDTFNSQKSNQSKQAFKLLFGDGEWVVKTIHRNHFEKFYIDMYSGKVTNVKKYAKKYAFDFHKTSTWNNKNSLTEVVTRLEKAGYLNIESVVWSGTNFKAHVCKNNIWQDVLVNLKQSTLRSTVAKPSLEIQ